MGVGKVGIFVAALLCIIHLGCCIDQQKFVSPWTYSCKDKTCIKEENTNNAERVTLTTCKMTCGEFGPLWPRPSGNVQLGSDVLPFKLSQLNLGDIEAPDKDVEQLLNKTFAIFQEKLLRLFPHVSRQLDPTKDADTHSFPEAADDNIVTVSLNVAWEDTQLSLTTDESYTLSVRTNGPTAIEAMILANTFFGARHGLETLFQLIDYDEINGGLQILTSASITDKPVFPYRAITMDTARNYINLPAIRRTIDGMSYAKLNTLHWHISDTHSFPFFTQSVPELTYYGAYSPAKIYTPEQIRETIEYATVRGVRIIPEFDAPAHVGNGWQWGPSQGKGNLAVCINQEPWQKYCVEPPCGQLNPANDEIYNVMGQMYQDYFNNFTMTDIFHMGGDEVNFNCWNTTAEIANYMDNNGIARDEAGFVELWDGFQQKAYNKVKAANGGKDINVILWTSTITYPEYLNKLNSSQNIIQIWTLGNDPDIANLVQNGFRVIFSNYDAMYLDCGYGAWVGAGNNWCAPYKGWQLQYSNSPYELLAAFQIPNLVENAKQNNLVLGASAVLWSEQVDEMALDGKLWPRASAVAERLWADPDTPWQAAEKRMYHNRERIQRLGIAADALQPEWCHQNERHCYAI